MSVPLIINGVTYNYPVQFDTNWAPTLTAWSTAVTNGMLQKAGGSFTLTSEVDFGATYGLRTAYIKSEESNISTTGFFRLANNSTGVGFRNSANSADLLLTVNTSNQLTFNGLPLGATTALLNTHILVGNVSNQPADVAMSGDTTITNTGIVTISNSAITNVKVAAAAAIAVSKLAALTASKAVVTDGSGFLTPSATTSTEIGYVSGATSNIQAQINAIPTAYFIPIGGSFLYSSNTPPSASYVPKDGRAISRSTYSTLFSLIGTTFGSGDGSTTFNIPNSQDRLPIGSGNLYTIGQTGGATTHTLTQSELSVALGTASITDPGHSHSVVPSGGGSYTGFSGSPINAGPIATVSGGPGASGTYGTTTNTTGITATITNSSGGNAHSILNPYLAECWMYRII